LKLSQIVVKRWTLFVFTAPFVGLGLMYTIHHKLIGKRVVDFLLVIIELLLGVTAVALRAKMD